MKKVFLILVIVVCGCSTTNSEKRKDDYTKVVVGKTEKCTYGYWKNGTGSYISFCECMYGYSCSVGN